MAYEKMSQFHAPADVIWHVENKNLIASGRHCIERKCGLGD
jgi:hypothetical protein